MYLNLCIASFLSQYIIIYFQDNQNSTNSLISFNADENVNDAPNSLNEGTLNDYGLEGMLPQIDEYCESRVQWRFDTCAPGSDPDRANRTTPQGFQVRKSGVPGAGLGVWTLEEIPPCTMIGPYGGVKKYDKNIWEKTWIYGWIIVDGDGTAKYVVDAENPAQSNWMRYINCAKSEESQNFHPFQYLGEMFYYTRHKIRAGRELFVWYGVGYAEHLGLLSTG